MTEIQQQIAADERLAFTVKESARLCSIGVSTFRKDMKAGKVRAGARNRILKAELVRYAEAEFGPRPKVGRPRGTAGTNGERQTTNRCRHLG